MLAVKNAVLVMPDHYIPDAVLLIENGKIVDFGCEVNIPDGADTIDAGGLFVGPGLVDIHTHADGKHYFFEEPESVSQTLLRHGVTSVLPAMYFNLTKEQYLAGIEKIDAAVASGRFPNFAGYYMEGPYLNPDYGCDKENNPWKGEIREEDYAEILEKTKKTAKVWCVSPEREGTLEFVKHVKSEIKDIVFSVAHSEASPSQIEELMPYGLKLGTHHTNATGTIVRYPECRGVCVDETVNYNPDIYAELICDSRGIHVDPYMLRLVRQIKGRDRIILISDACVFDGPPIPGCENVTDINFDFNGEIAGSKLTLDIACRNMMVHTGSSVCEVFRYASYNPSHLLGRQDIGQIKRGNKADLIFVDPWFHVKKIIIEGREI